MTEQRAAALERLGGDFYGYQGLLSGEEEAILGRVRSFLNEEARPIVDDAWMRSEFPHQLVPGLAELDIVGIQREGAPGPTARRLLIGFLALELARCDPSLNSFVGIQAGLVMGSIEVGGDEEQRQRWLPGMAMLQTVGAFGLTEPHGGSDVAGGLETTARRDGEEWILNGAKRWIGNGTFADVVVIWARVEDSDTIHGFVVDRDTPGFVTKKMEGKLALRITQNAEITLTDCRIPEADRLHHVDNFDAISDVLARTRGGAAWASVGTMMAAYELALAYATQREQFGRPIASFQLVQDLLVRMLGNVTASLGMAVRLAQLQDDGEISDSHSALAKAYCSTRMREVVSWAREVLGGNGILIDHHVGRFFNDAEALYSYEGTREMNTLIVGRDITGHSAFT
ncbi:MAG: acyl-CoA dehydrogenase family protein [Actinomycetota bacterium]|nr:acyl-CoA dehydrogenase family protein [Actinomycetota bacterium]